MRTGFRLTLGSLVIAACTSSEPAPDVEPESASEPTPTENPSLVWVEPPPKLTGVERELGALLGGRVVARDPTPGRWSSRMDFSQHRFITVEHTVETHIEGSAVLRLTDDGQASACFATSEFGASAMSHYQARDGKDHYNSSDHAMVVGMTGTWKLEGEGPDIAIRFDRMEWRTCEVDPTKEPFEQPAMRCFGFAANTKVPSDALLCEVPRELTSAMTLSLLIGDSKRAGPWEMRFDPAGHGSVDLPPEDARPWLLLGAEPGLVMSAEDHDRDAKPLTIEVGAVTDPADLPEPKDP
jgi:hypothetical protein